jgi:hypothetical protein
VIPLLILAAVQAKTPENRVSWSGKSDFRFRYRMVDRLEPGFEEDFPNLHDYLEQVERINLLGTAGPYALGIQVDQVGLYRNRYILDDEMMRSWQLHDSTVDFPSEDVLLVPEKVFLTWEGDSLSLGAGDVYASFGRGIALNVIKNTDVDIDTSIRGAKAAYNVGPAELTVISGLTNKQQISRNNINLGISDDIAHMISGAQLMLYGIGPAQIGVHSVLTRFGRDRETAGYERYTEGLDAVVTGADVELFGLAGIDWYLEGDVFTYFDETLMPEETEGEGLLDSTPHVLYGSMSFYPVGTVVLIEGKHTKNAERINTFVASDVWELSTPPSLEYERMITEDSSATVNSNDAFGGRIRIDVPIKPSVLTPFMAVSAFRDLDTEGLHFNEVPETIVHPVLGVQYLPTGKIIMLNAGFRQDFRDDSDYKDQLAHFDAEYSTPLFGDEGLEINLSGWKFWWGDDHHSDFITLQNALVWRHGDQWDFILYQDWSNNTQLQSVGNLTDELYGALELRYKPTNALSIRTLVGAYKAGIRCSGGQCRMLPGFEGGELAVTASF